MQPSELLVPVYESDDEETQAAAEEEEEESKESKEQEWEVEKIVGRHMSRGGEPTYRVRWAGFREEDDTYEKEENLAHLEKFKEFIAAQPEPRRSSRLAGSSNSGELPDNTGSDFDSSDNGSGRIAMVMAALRGAVSDSEWPGDATMEQAVRLENSTM